MPGRRVRCAKAADRMRSTMTPKILLNLIVAFTLLPFLAVGQEDGNGQAKRIGHPNDPAARAFLREAEERRATWSGFPGFTGELRVYANGQTHKGEVTISSEGKARVELGDGEARKWVLSVMNSIVATSNVKEFEERYENVGVVFGKDDLHPLGLLLELRGDPYQTKFRIQDKEIRVVDRSTSQERIFLHIVSIERDSEDRKRARSFVVYYFSKEAGELKRSEAIRDERTIVDGHVLPELWTETVVSNGTPVTRSLSISNHSLLSEPPVQSAKRRRP